MNLDLTDEESAALLRRPIDADRYPLSPRVRTLQAILDKIEEEELADWRAGRNAVYQLAALTIGTRLAVADA